MCRNYQVRTNLFMPTVCRFAVGGDTCPRPTGAVSFIVVRFSHVDCEERSDVVAQSFMTMQWKESLLIIAGTAKMCLKRYIYIGSHRHRSASGMAFRPPALVLPNHATAAFAASRLILKTD